MKPAESSQPTVKRADPALQERPSKDAFRPFGLPRPIGFLLYAFFWVVLLVPFIRRLRRRPSWNRIRWIAFAAGLLPFAAAWALPQTLLAVCGGILAIGALLLPPATDPDRERKLQTRHGADYFLNGGEFVAGRWPGETTVPLGTRLYLLLRGRELLAVPLNGEGDVQASLSIDMVRQVLVAGENYIPVYVSEAKDPPRREKQVDRSAKTAMELVLANGEKLRFEHTGAFSKHLAETAAHAIYSVWRLGGTDGVGGQSPEIFHVIGR